MTKFLKILLSAPVVVAALFGFFYLEAFSHQARAQSNGTVSTLDQWKSDGTNITQRTASKPLKLTGLESKNCLGTNASGIVGLGTCGSGGSSFAYPFPLNATSTQITFSGGIVGNLTGNASTVTNGVYTTTFNGLFDNRLSASTSISGITTLPNLSLPYSQLTGTPAIFAYPFIGNATTTLIAFNGGLTATNATTTNTFSGRDTANTAAFGQTGSTTISSTGALSTPSLTIGSLSGLIAANSGATYATATGTVSNGTGISVTAGQSVIGSGLTITNTGVTSLVAGTNITISASTGAVTVTGIGYPFPSNATTTLLSFNGNASTTGLSVTGKSYFGATATTTIDTTGNIVIPSGSGLTNTGRSDGCATWASAVLTSTGIACGSGSGGAAYPFQVAGNATSTLTQFNGGLTSYGTTTIGGGSTTTGLTISGGATTTGTAYFVGQVGIGTSSPFTGALAIDSAGIGTNTYLTGSRNGFLELNIQNRNTGSSASGDFVATADNGSATTHYIDLGINSSGGGGQPFTAANNAYLYSVGDTLNIGALGASSVITFNTTGGISAPLERGRFDASGNFGIATSTPGTPLSVNGDAVIAGRTTARIFNATSTLAASTFPYASTTMISASGSASTTALVISGTRSAALITSADGTVSGYGGASACAANNFVTGLNALIGTTCGTGTISGVNIGSNLFSHTVSADFTGTAYNGSAAVSDWVLKMSQPHIWTGLQSFANASSTLLSNTGIAYFGGTATTTIDAAGNVTIPATAKLTAPYASTTAITATTASSTNTIVSSLATPAGTIVAADATGKLIATTTPGGGTSFGGGIEVDTVVGAGTFTVPAGITKVWVEAVAGGGGSDIAGSGAGGYCFKLITGLTPGGTIAYSIGDGGNAGTNGATGSTGGSTTVGAAGAYCSVTGGAGGNSGANPSSGGGSANGDINITGGDGGKVVTTTIGGAGGDSPHGWGLGGAGIGAASGARSGTGYGAGAGGVNGGNTGGAKGQPGIVVWHW